MVRLSLIAVLFLALTPRADDTSEKWQFAGESQGVSFYLKVRHECRDHGSNVSVKLESQLDYAVLVSFRINDPNWRKTFTKELKPHGSDSRLAYSPEESGACHPFVDEVTVEPKEKQAPQVSQKQTDDD
jgi:hypothetical protein